ncbi:extracellular serine/threonine protein kinase four-jointed-like [Penaeus japonicus]|uniref:extracellular serine/threonine protein kinase four-jointed-like n=1 Tax=Penaeus japonicus TaxID=27405 RepID=UPI001C70BDE4|nr:extracellular serine/threonine protein kinase four-jointed-like [Penaeus japonicus]
MKVEAGSFSISLPSTPLPARSSRVTCVVAATLAFLLGVAVGVTLPIVLVHSPLSSSVQVAFARQDASRDTGSFIQPMKKPEGVRSLTASVHTWSPYIASKLGINNDSSSTPSLRISNDVSATDQNDIQSEWRQMPSERDVPDVEEATALLVDGIYWADSVEGKLPTGFSDSEVDEWRKFTRQHAVVRLEEGCGRMQNRLIIFENGTKSCCRYRQNYDQIQGEIFSFYLSRLLGLTNVPPSALGVVKASAWQWSNVGSQLALAQWTEERPVVMTRFIEGLVPAFIPSSLREAKRRLHPMNVEEQDPQNVAALIELAQWSDLVIFDYLTANLDRVVNNLYNMQWNPKMMEAPAHNLARHKQSGLLVFLDNESGLLHGYRLLDKYESFHASLLKALCVFRRSTAERVRQLVLRRDVGDRLRKMFRRYEPDLQDYLPPIPDKSIKILNERLQNVHKQIAKCEKWYRNS